MDNPDLIFIDAVTRLTTEIVLAGNGEQSALYTSDGVNSTIETDINALMLNNDSNDYDNGSQFGRTAIHRLSLPLPFAIDYYHTTSSSQRLPHTPSLSGLIGLVQDFINDTVQLLGKQPCLLIDDLGMLLNVGVEPKELHHFLSYLQRTLSKVCSYHIKHIRTRRRTLTQVGGHLVVLMHADGYRERDDVTVVIDELIYGSHYIIRSQAFVSGQSAELDGELSLDRGPLNMDPEFNRQTLHYKLTEQSELKLYGKGLSSAVM